MWRRENGMPTSNGEPLRLGPLPVAVEELVGPLIVGASGRVAGPPGAGRRSVPLCRGRSRAASSARSGCLRGSGEVAPSAPRRTVLRRCGGISPARVHEQGESNPRPVRFRAPRGGCLQVRGWWEVPRRSAGTAGAASRGQLVARLVARRRRLLVTRVVAGPLARHLGQRALDLAPHPADRDAEDALAALDQVDDLVGRRALVDAGPVAHQGDLGQVVDPPLAEVADGGADVLQRYPGVEQPLDDLEHEDVAEAVEALAAGAGGRADARLDQAGARPVVELAVGDARGRA